MKQYLILLLIMGVSVMQGQIYSNLGFEEDRIGDQAKEANWEIDEDSQAQLVTDIVFAGKNAILLEGEHSPESPGFFYQQVSFEGKDLKHYRVSAVIKYEGVKDGTLGIYAFCKQDDLSLGYEHMRHLQLSGSADWKRYEVDIWVAPQATDLRIGGQLTGSGKVWFDDFLVEEIDDKKEKVSKKAEKYIDEFFEIIQENSIVKDKVDWSAIRAEADRIAAGAEEIEDCYPMIRYTLDRLDKHSFFMTAARVKAWQNTSKSDEDEDDKPKEFSNVEMSTGKLIEGQYGYISMPGLGSGDPVTLVEFADQLQSLIEEIDSDGVKGWVLDLRNNTGGNCWPMLAGIGPILGEGICGYFVTAKEKNSWYYKNGSSGSNSYDITTVSRTPYQVKKAQPPVAVLTGPMTASSGEVVVVAFRERPNTKSFGKATGGYSTANRNFPLSDGSMILLAVSTYADRSGQLYGETIVPDVVVDSSKGEDENDTSLEAALEWLKSQ